jgi:hypothetical protein
LIENGVAIPEPIVYEDFSLRSAAGIFQSNLTDGGTRDDACVPIAGLCPSARPVTVRLRPPAGPPAELFGPWGTHTAWTTTTLAPRLAPFRKVPRPTLRQDSSGRGKLGGPLPGQV